MASLEAARYSKVFKKLRVTLIRELPDPVAMLDRPELKDRFSGYERSQILTPATMCERREKFVDVMELCSSEAVFQQLLSLLRQLKPHLAKELEGALREVEGTPNAGGSNRAGPPNPDGSSKPTHREVLRCFGVSQWCRNFSATRGG